MVVNNTITIDGEYVYISDPELFVAIENNRQRMANLSLDVDRFAVTLDGDQVVDGESYYYKD